MSTLSMLQDWRARVRADLFPRLHGHLVKCLADFSFAMATSCHCHSGRLAVLIPTQAKPSSQCRRIERLLANPRLRPNQAFGDLIKHCLRPRAGLPVLLILDEVHNGNDLACMRVCLGYRKRAIPLIGCCYRRDRPPGRMPAMIQRLLRQVARHVPPGCRVTLLMDRGLAWPAVLRTCLKLGWHFAARLQSRTRLRRADGTVVTLRDLVPAPGRRQVVRGRVFKKSGWIEGIVTAVWEYGCREPWLLFSDRESSYQACRSYAKRMWIEELFRDEKSQGFHWESSRVRKPAHAARLLVVMALAVLMALCLGAWVIKSGHRKDLDSRRQRRLSLFQLGVRWLRRCLIQEKQFPPGLRLHPS
jgi:Transposase DDE domain